MLHLSHYHGSKGHSLDYRLHIVCMAYCFLYFPKCPLIFNFSKFKISIFKIILKRTLSRNYDLASHTTHVVCVNFTRVCWDLQFNIDFERQIFGEAFSCQVYLLSEFLPEICWEEVAEEIISYIRFEAWPNMHTQYLLGYGYFNSIITTQSLIKIQINNAHYSSPFNLT